MFFQSQGQMISNQKGLKATTQLFIPHTDFKVNNVIIRLYIIDGDKKNSLQNVLGPFRSVIDCCS